MRNYIINTALVITTFLLTWIYQEMRLAKELERLRHKSVAADINFNNAIIRLLEKKEIDKAILLAKTMSETLQDDGTK